MPDLILDSAVLQDCLDRWRTGDRSAADDLLRMAQARLAKLAHRMIRGFPIVRVMADTDDLLQNSLLRLLQTLRCIRPKTTRDFFNMAAVHIRRELLDLARKASRRPMAPVSLTSTIFLTNPEPEVPMTTDVDLWIRFHKAVDQLPLEEREIFGLAFYHGWTHTRIAELFQVDERTIRRRWASARQRLQEIIGSTIDEE